MIDETALHTWLQQLTIDRGCPLQVPFEAGPDIREYANADVAGSVTMLPGYGLANDSLFDRPSFQVLVRAREHQLTELRQTVQTIDKVLVQEVDGEQLWGTWVVLTGRAGGAPMALQQDTRERRAYVCTYFAKVEL